jgi:DNA-binding Lrp family transcriptional regulator
MHAYILVALDEIGVEDVVEEFRDMDEVEEAHILFGEWDLIIKLKASTPEEVAQFVLDKVRSRDEVRLTSTLIVAK